jgi:hypothetical protein
LVPISTKLPFEDLQEMIRDEAATRCLKIAIAVLTVVLVLEEAQRRVQRSLHFLYSTAVKFSAGCARLCLV